MGYSTTQRVGGRLALFILICLIHTSIWAQPVPQAATFFPQDTAAFFSIPNVSAAKTAFLQSSLGRMASDPDLRPFLTDMWSALVKASEQFEKESGVSLSAILAVPQGEFSLGFVSSGSQGWVLLGFLDVGPNAETVQKLVDFAVERARKEGAIVRTEKVEDVDLHVVVPPDEENRIALGLALDNSRLLGGVAFAGVGDLEVLRNVIRRAKGSAASSGVLADQQKFKRFLGSIRYAKQGEIHGMLFADPLQILEGLKKMNPTAAVTLAILPVLGLDGLNSVGAATSLDVAGWDWIREVHVFMDNPRRGVLDIPAFKKGDGTPEFFVPDSVMAYVTLYLDLATTLERVAKLYDGFRGDGTFQQQVINQINRRLGIDLTQDVLPATTGRVSFVWWIERPIRVNSTVIAVVLELENPESATKLAEAIAQSQGESFEKKEFGNQSYYLRTAPSVESPSDTFRRPVPSFASIGQYLVSTDSPALMEQFLTTAASQEHLLRDSLEFKLVRGRVKTLAGTESPPLFSFSRPDVGIEIWYEGFVSGNPLLRQAMAEGASQNSFAAAIVQAIEGGKLPPIEVLKRYFAPQGSVLIDDAFGLHFVSFGLRKKLP